MKSRTDGKNETKKPKPEPDDKEQSERFIEKAKELEADKNAENFERAFKIIVPPNKPNESEGKT
jgi:hypothetical protein